MTPKKRKPSARRSGRTRQSGTKKPAGLRIIGGRFRGRKLLCREDPRLRPMKNRVREAVFNLIGPAVQKKHAVDLFAGSGALGLEAISRGAAGATLIEQHFPTAEIIRRNVASLDIEEITQIVTANVFLWWKQAPELPPTAWVVFCSPPWDFFVEQTEAVLALIDSLAASAPSESLLVVEADGRFDFSLLPQSDAWDVRRYPPAVVGIYEKPK